MATVDTQMQAKKMNGLSCGLYDKKSRRGLGIMQRGKEKYTWVRLEGKLSMLNVFQKLFKNKSSVNNGRWDPAKVRMNHEDLVSKF